MPGGTVSFMDRGDLDAMYGSSRVAVCFPDHRPHGPEPPRLHIASRGNLHGARDPANAKLSDGFRRRSCLSAGVPSLIKTVAMGEYFE